MILDRYIARSVISGTFSALLVLAALFTFIGFVRQIEYIGTKDFGVLQATFYVLLSLPQRLYELAPSMILVGGLISLGSMASGSELIVMRASGITVGRIARSVLQVGLVMALFVAFAGEILVPYSTSMAKTLRATAMDDRVLVGGKHGLWARDGNRYISIGRVMPGMQLRDIDVYELDENRALKISTHARYAEYKGDHWLLSKVDRSVITEKGVETFSLKQEVWHTLVKTELFEVLRLQPDDMSASDLLQYSNYLEQNELDAVPYQLTFWIKVFTPLTCLVMLLVAMPLVINSNSRSGGTGQKVIIGVLLGTLFFVFNRAVNHLGVVYGYVPVLSAAMPLILITIIAVVLLRRVR